MTLARLLAASLLAVLFTGCATVTPPPAPVPAPAPAVTQAPVKADPPPPPPRPQAQIPRGPMQEITTVGTLSRPAVAALEAPSDLWERIRRGFAMPDLSSDLVREREQWYLARPDYISRMTDRSRKYLFHIVEELERRDMPTELALLPFVESAFNPQAVSTAKAAGMWQFMPATGRSFELKQNAFRDDRRDVLESTRAALDYLQRLHRMFGDWHLALAAYNWGEGNVGRSIARNQRSGQGTGYTDIDMPAETRHYVPKLQALKNIIAQPAQLGAQLPVIENHPYFQTVDIRRDIDVELAARLAEVDLTDFRSLNPSFHRPVILAAGTPQILLPWDNAAIFERNLEAHGDRPLASWTAWVVPATLSVATAARHAGMNEAEFRRLNGIPPSMMVKAGSTLLIPRNPLVHTDVSEHLADNGQLSLAPEVVTRRTMVKARKGDTPATVARRHGLSAVAVAGWNGMGISTAFKAGQQIVLHLPVRAAPSGGRGRSAGATDRKARSAATSPARKAAQGAKPRRR